ncbi:hypothetical protein HK099_008539 [Clydaea vesicula]|uniref:DUF6593 domain-containing protein n=1 Tax=Clydaea vesicula TaxID=447962 RepID=A0AAD5U7T7_9FUNG|nr:hypothetical protein HK099_008539 [Clydaea vesicula]KAJ3391605.1 hypothetical protein HDU92_008954 [Lobulomyces angularis]
MDSILKKMMEFEIKKSTSSQDIARSSDSSDYNDSITDNCTLKYSHFDSNYNLDKELPSYSQYEKEKTSNANTSDLILNKFDKEDIFFFEQDYADEKRTSSYSNFSLNSSSTENSDSLPEIDEIILPSYTAFLKSKTELVFQVIRKKDYKDTVYKAGSDIAFRIPTTTQVQKSWKTTVLQSNEALLHVEKEAGDYFTTIKSAKTSDKVILKSTGWSTIKREFTGFDNLKYAWKGNSHMTLIQYGNNKEKVVVAKFRSGNSSFLLGNSNTGSLNINPCGFHMVDLIVATSFICEETLRRGG